VQIEQRKTQNSFSLLKQTKTIYFLFIKQRRSKLIKGDSKDVNNVTKDFYFK